MFRENAPLRNNKGIGRMFRIYPYVCNRKQTKNKIKDMKYDIPALTAEAVGLLKSLISIPSVSRDEEKAADCLQQ